MVSADRANALEGLAFMRGKVRSFLVFLYLSLTLAVFLTAPVLYMRASSVPFLGAFVEHSLIINTSQPTINGAWGEALRLPFGYQIRSVDGQPVNNVRALEDVLTRYSPGDAVALEVAAPDGSPKLMQIQLMRLPALDRLSYFLIPYLTGLIYLVCGIYVFVIRRYDPAGRAFSLFSASTALALATLFDLYTTNMLTPVWVFALAMTGGALINLGLLFPESVPLARRFPFIGWLGYLVAFALTIAGAPALYNMQAPFLYVSAWRSIYIFVVAALVFFMAQTFYRQQSSASTQVREQARLIFRGGVLSFVPLGVWLLLTVFLPDVRFTPLYLMLLAFFPVFTGYAILRYRLLHTDYILSQSVLYSLLAGLVISAYGLLLGGLSVAFGQSVQDINPLALGALVFLLAIFLQPVRNRLQTIIDRYFFRGQVVYRELQQAFGQELTHSMELPAILRLLRKHVEDALHPTTLHIFVYDPLNGRYAASSLSGNSGTAPSSDVRFPAGSPLVQLLWRKRETIFLADITDVPTVFAQDQARLALLAASLYTPLPGRKQLIGWLALGPRHSGEPYSARDLNFIEALSNQAALAIERTQVVTDLERRVREMNVLTRVAQGVSFTVAFDDILELISAQTNLILPARDFRITLVDPDSSVLFHAIFLENDERLQEKEKRPLPLGVGLEPEVIQTQRPIITDDYERECRSRGLLPNAPGVLAWMGVPLNAGASTIGVLSIGCRDLGVIYTDEQRNLLQAIADQASGAIVKARSLEESERRALQLTKLNEIGLGLTSTLDLKRLLNQILESATDILNCEAGSLFLVDEQTDELVFEVVLSPVATNLLGRRLPPGAGLVGQAVSTGKPVIANDAKRRKEWFEKTDEQTGFSTQDLLVVPMRIQDRVIGAIEVINKASGAPFTQADQELLSAFTSQATIAIENARLYTMTDQALAARVEELSAMQRIARELNATLDIERAMRLTLDWAMRQSRADAGLVGMVENDGLRVMASQGYTPDALALTEGTGGETARPESSAPGSLLPIGWMSEAIEKGNISYRVLDLVDLEDQATVLPGARRQIVTPIRRETRTIGVVLLESQRPETVSEDLTNFLSRLSDHAAIAIANAQLYEEIKEANLAKSRFVSFVAHELKNPMASIKGYTELVSSGMAGPVNEMQHSFLETVRSNVDRMNTIVSDLNDLTKLQTGNLRLDYRAVRVMDVFEEVSRSIKRQVEEKKQQIAVQIPEELPPVWADQSRLAQILTNLVSNAHKYTPEGKTLSVSAETLVEQEGSLAGATLVHIWVADEGIGISEADQKRIFQQYFRTDSAKEMASGTGLGLAITKSLIELQGGRIWFESEFGQGATFHFTLPVAETQ